jgi:calcineurin-like phosphoesterase family protein
VLSLWQSAADQIRANRKARAPQTAMEMAWGLDAQTDAASTDLTSPIRMVAAALSGPEGAVSARSIDSISDGGAADLPVGAVLLDCARTAAEFLLAEMKGEKERAQVLANELKFSACDALGWGECVTTYLAYKAAGGDLPYRKGRDEVFELKDRKKIAIVGDWGTGSDIAKNVLEQVCSCEPDVLVHLGDVYYAGTQPEQQSHFVDLCQQVLGKDVLLFSLCGNHDMYSGGAGYYWLIDTIGQKSSYFCLRNDSWQFLAMDTGHNDHNPATVDGNMTSLVTEDGWSEGDWLLARILRPAGRRTVLLSHHQLFSPFASVGSEGSVRHAYNPNLYSVFKDVMPQIEWWFWGHEHTLAVYDPYMKLERGRCLGASAVPVFTDQQKYAKDTSGLRTFDGGPLPTWNSTAVLGDNGTDYHHAFAIMTLNGPSAKVEYYQVPLSGEAKRLCLTEGVPVKTIIPQRK